MFQENNSNGSSALSGEILQAMEVYFASKGFDHVAKFEDLKSSGFSGNIVDAALLTGFLSSGPPGYALSRKTLAQIGILIRTPRGQSDDYPIDELPVYMTKVGKYVAGLVDTHLRNSDSHLLYSDIESAIGRGPARQMKKSGMFRVKSTGLYEITQKAVDRRVAGLEFTDFLR